MITGWLETTEGDGTDAGADDDCLEAGGLDDN